MATIKGLRDPMLAFCKAIQENAHKKGREIASEHFDGAMADVMGEVFGNMLANGVVNTIGGSLFDVPMEPR